MTFHATRLQNPILKIKQNAKENLQKERFPLSIMGEP